mmetsp:Transcript_4198/g.14801  ORF Transcript_4198/g.14801 Transcript_4198/m.14801 type:complete len:481 (-) Transcript_4198:490-1932(-)
MIRGLPPNSKRETVADTMKAYGPLTSVVIVSDRGRSIHRGIAFIAFKELKDAVACYKHQAVRNGTPHMMVCGADVEVHYSVTERKPKQPVYNDWLCRACNSTNFARRSLSCYHCGALKPAESELQLVKTYTGESQQFDPTPSPTLIIRNLGLDATSDNVKDAFSAVGVRFESANVSKDAVTGSSRGVAFVDYKDADTAAEALSKVSPEFRVAGQKVLVNFYNPRGRRSHLNPVAENTANASRERSEPKEEPTSPDPAAQAQASAFLSSLDASPAAAVAAPISRTSLSPVITAPVVPVAPQTVVKLGIPDEQDYVLDESSGYYYNAKINYYYDANTGYFFNATTQQYFLYDPTTQAFVPYDSDSSFNAPKKIQETKNPVKSVRLTPAPTTVAHPPKPTIIINKRLAVAPAASAPAPAPAPAAAAEPVCYLCKRRLPSMEALEKHKQLSALHKKNLELAAAKRARGEEEPAGQPDQKRARRE